ncbi:MAG: M23 family metallopeptidase [Bacilli bacterium]|nr:M23 family metallopeptidase [Bacilli bacterium]
MTNRRLKKPVVIALYALSFFTFIGLIYLLEGAISNLLFDDDDGYEYVSDIIIDDDIPVVATTEVIIRPYVDKDITILRNFYDYESDADVQENAIIYYDGQYMQSTGTAYGKEDIFDVVSILDGTVIDVQEDSLLGKVVQIQHSDDLVSVYQSLSEVLVNIGDVVTQGSIIGKSGVSNLSKDLNNHLYFEIIYKGNNINPEDCYDKKVKEL